MKSDGAHQFSLKTLGVTDASELHSLAILTYKDTYRDLLTSQEIESRIAGKYQLRHFVQLLSDPTHFFWGIYLQETLMAYLHLSSSGKSDSVSTEHLMQLCRIYVHPHSKGKGIGRALMETAEDFSKSKGFQGLWLHCFDQNLKSIQFYEKSNFKILGKDRFEIVAGFERFDVVMLKTNCPL